MAALKILTFNWHEAYLCLLAKTGHEFTAVDKSKGGHEGWLQGTRPVPANIRLLPPGSEEEAISQARSGKFDLAICHNLRDLADVAKIPIPKIVVFHNMLSTEVALHKAGGQPFPGKAPYIAQFLSLFDEKTKAVFISETKRKDAAGIDGRVITPGIDMDEYSGYRGDIARALRVGNFFTGRDIMLGQTIAVAALKNLPATILGINPEIPESRLSASWEDLKEHYRSHRAFLNMTIDGFEDGYNLAMLEAMATGMPIVSASNRTSPLNDGVDGFVSGNPETLHRRIKTLLADRSLAQRMGARARNTVADKFPLSRFIERWNEAFGEAIEAHRAEKMPSPSLVCHGAGPEISSIEKEGQALLSARAWSQARSYLENKLEIFPDAASLWKMLGFAYGNLGRTPDAIRAFWAAAKMNPADQEAQRMLVWGLTWIAPDSHPEDNPESAVLECVCRGAGIDVGCGPNKTSPNAIGVDLAPSGSLGTAGGVKGLASVADVCVSGDGLFMFQDGQFDFVVSRHNLEHYQDPLKALEEWKRVLKPGGILGMVLPDDRNSDTIHLDESHKHVFTPDSLSRLVRYLGGFDVIHLGTCLWHWSFTAVFQKCGGKTLDYPTAYLQAQSVRCTRRANFQEEAGEPFQALECWREAVDMDGSNPAGIQGQIRMLRRLGRLKEAEMAASDLRRRFPEAAQMSQMDKDADGGQPSESPIAAADLRLEARQLMTSRRGSMTPNRLPSSDNPEAKLGRGRILLSTGKDSEAGDLFAQWVKEDPSSPFALIGLGCVALVCSRWEEAERHFRSALELRPEDSKALGGLGFSLAAAGRETEAVEAFVMSLQNEPLQGGVFQALVRAALAAGRYTEALDAVKNCIKLQPENPHLLFSAAVLAARLGNTGEALSMLDRVEAIHSSYPKLAEFRAAWQNPSQTAVF